MYAGSIPTLASITLFPAVHDCLHSCRNIAIADPTLPLRAISRQAPSGTHGSDPRLPGGKFVALRFKPRQNSRPLLFMEAWIGNAIHGDWSAHVDLERECELGERGIQSELLNALHGLTNRSRIAARAHSAREYWRWGRPPAAPPTTISQLPGGDGIRLSKAITMTAIAGHARFSFNASAKLRIVVGRASMAGSLLCVHALVAKSVDATDLKSVDRKVVPVRVRPGAQNSKEEYCIIH